MAFISYDEQGNISIRSIHSKTKQAMSSRVLEERTSKTNIYIKGLPSHFNDKLLSQMVPFKDKIRSIKTATEDNGKCKGYGFIDFFDEESAKEAISFLEKKYPNNSVKPAKENEKDRTNLYVTNLPREWTNDDNDKLKTIFLRYGHVQSAFIMQDRGGTSTSGVGFVRFSSELDATKTIESLHRDRIVLPSCDQPLEAKLADKHNSETRKRRIPDSAVKCSPQSKMSPYNYHSGTTWDTPLHSPLLMAMNMATLFNASYPSSLWDKLSLSMLPLMESQITALMCGSSIYSIDRMLIASPIAGHSGQYPVDSCQTSTASHTNYPSYYLGNIDSTNSQTTYRPI